MSEEIQKIFKEVVELQYSYSSQILALSSPCFDNIGYLTKATLTGTGGVVEILCGPPEYHADLFIENSDLKQRFGLPEILSSEAVQVWAKHNRPDQSEPIRIKREVAWLFSLLTDILCQDERFTWLFNS